MKTETIRCGVKFCGGCNPRYDRGAALDRFKAEFEGRVSFETAKEGSPFDLLLVIGGCTSFCASYDQYETRRGVVKVWNETHIGEQIEMIKKILKVED